MVPPSQGWLEVIRERRGSGVGADSRVRVMERAVGERVKSGSG